MAFAGYEVTRANVYDHMKSDVSGVWWETFEWLNAVEIFKHENHTGDCIMVWEQDTEEDSTLIYSLFNDPYNGWVCDYGKLPN